MSCGATHLEADGLRAGRRQQARLAQAGQPPGRHRRQLARKDAHCGARRALQLRQARRARRRAHLDACHAYRLLEAHLRIRCDVCRSHR